MESIVKLARLLIGGAALLAFYAGALLAIGAGLSAVTDAINSLLRG